MEQIFTTSPLKGTNPADNLILNFQSLELWYNTFLLFKLPSLWYLSWQP